MYVFCNVLCTYVQKGRVYVSQFYIYSRASARLVAVTVAALWQLPTILPRRRRWLSSI